MTIYQIGAAIARLYPALVSDDLEVLRSKPSQRQKGSGRVLGYGRDLSIAEMRRLDRINGTSLEQQWHEYLVDQKEGTQR